MKKMDEIESVEPKIMRSAESGRPMVRGEKPLTLTVGDRTYNYRQPGWWCSLDNPDDLEGQLTGPDNQVRALALATAKALAAGKPFPPALIRAIRINCGLTQREAGRLFGSGEKAFEKYEAGLVAPSGPMQRLLGLALKRPDLFRKGSPDWVALPMAADAETIREAIQRADLDRAFEPLFEGNEGSKMVPG